MPDNEPIYRPGRIIAGRYRITSALSQGGMGAVYLAQQVSLGRDVALKVILERGSDPELIKRFDVEARAVCLLKHPNIITYHDYGRDEEGHPFLVMEFLAGYPGTRLVYGDRRPKVQDLVHVVAQVCSALHEAHRNNIVHRDLKWSNVMVCPQSHDPFFTKLIDFGILKVATDGSSGDQRAMTRTGMLLGTPEYMSPEAICGMPIDGRADQYSLAVMLWEALEGRRPFEANSHFELLRQQVQDPPPPFETASELAETFPELVAVIERGMEKHPDDRYDSILEFQQALMASIRAGSRQVTTAPGRPSARPSPPSQRGVGMPVSKRSMAQRTDLPAPRAQEPPRPVDTRVKTGQRQADEDRPPRRFSLPVLAAVVLAVGGGAAGAVLALGGSGADPSPTAAIAEAAPSSATGGPAVSGEAVGRGEPAALADVVDDSGEPALAVTASTPQRPMAASVDAGEGDDPGRAEPGTAGAAAGDVEEPSREDAAEAVAVAAEPPTVPVDTRPPPVTTEILPSPERRETAPGRLVITTEPWSYISLNGGPARESPLTMDEVKPGRYTITVSNPGQFRGKHTFTVQVKPGAATTRLVRLKDHLEPNEP
jgi:serine/threonine-protein kinase